MIDQEKLSALTERAKKNLQIPCFHAFIHYFVESDWKEITNAIDDIYPDSDKCKTTVEEAYGVTIIRGQEGVLDLFILVSLEKKILEVTAHEIYHVVGEINRSLDNSLGEEARAEMFEWIIGELIPETNLNEEKS